MLVFITARPPVKFGTDWPYIAWRTASTSRCRLLDRLHPHLEADIGRFHRVVGDAVLVLDEGVPLLDEGVVGLDSTLMK